MKPHISTTEADRSKAYRLHRTKMRDANTRQQEYKMSELMSSLKSSSPESKILKQEADEYADFGAKNTNPNFNFNFNYGYKGAGEDADIDADSIPYMETAMGNTVSE